MADSSTSIALPQNIEKLSPYIAGKTIAEVRKAYHPSQISKLASNENRLGYSPYIKDAIMKAVTTISDYPDPASCRLRAALAAQNDVGTENVMVAGGSESLIAILYRTFFRDNEEAITADVTFVGFFVQANIRGVNIKKVPLTEHFRFDIDAMIEAVSDQTKMIYIANPNNPTGTYITKDEFERLMEKIPQDVLVIMDEAYYEFAEVIADFPHAKEYHYPNVISLRTFSKAYGLAGMRVGYAIGPEMLISSMMKTKLTFEPTALAQAAALAALNDQPFLNKSREIIRKGRKRLYHFFDERSIQYVPSVSNAVLMICKDELQAKVFTQGMLENGVILRQVGAFGLPNGVRITIGTDREMEHFEESFEQVEVF